MLKKDYIYIKELKDGVLVFENGDLKGIKAAQVQFADTNDEEQAAIERLKDSQLKWMR